MNQSLLIIGFRLHDSASDFIAKHLFLIKRLLLIVAYLSLFFILFPALRRGFGGLAEGMLLGILFLSPLSKIFRMRLLIQLMGLRREMGILMGCLALVHGLSYFVDPISFSTIAPYLNTDFFGMQPIFSFGIFTLVLTLPLLFTSNNLSLRFLGGKRWKLLHLTVYAVFLLMLAHIFFFHSMRRGYSPSSLIQPASLVLGYVLLKVLAWKNFIAPLRNMISSIGDRYKEYSLVKNVSV